MAKMKSVIIIKDTIPVNAIVLSSDNLDEWMASYDGTAVVPDPEDDFGTEFTTLTGCIAVDVTELSPMPGLGNGWTYVNDEWVAPPVEETDGS